MNMLVKQRDNEIAILVNYLNKKKAGEEPGVPVHRTNDSTHDHSTVQDTSFQEEQKQPPPTLYQAMRQPQFDKSVADKRRDFEAAQDAIKQANGIPKDLVSGSQNFTLEDLADRTKAFEHFRKSYRKNEAMEDNRNLLKEKYARGKQLGASVNDLRG